MARPDVSAEDENRSRPQPALRPRDTHSARRRALAFQISLGVHALFVLMLFRMYSEYSVRAVRAAVNCRPKFGTARRRHAQLRQPCRWPIPTLPK